MVDFVNLDVQWVYDVVVDKLKVLMTHPLLHVALPPREKVVGHRDLVTLQHQTVHEVRSHKSCSTRYLQINIVSLIILNSVKL